MLVDTQAKFDELRGRLVDLHRRGWPEPIGYDVESFGPEFKHKKRTKLDATRHRLAGYSVSFLDGARYYVALRHPETLGPGGEYTAPAAHWKLLGFLAQPAARVWVHNWKFELAVLTNEGITVNCTKLDSEIAAWMAGWRMKGKGEGAGGLKLKPLAAKHLGHEGPSFDDVAKGRAVNTIPAAEIAPYAADDASLTLRLGELAYKRVVELDAVDHFNLEMRCIPVTEHMERSGVVLDREQLLADAARCEEEAAEVAVRFEELTRCEVTVPVKVRRPKPCPCGGSGGACTQSGRKFCVGGVLHHKNGKVVLHTVLEVGNVVRGARVGSDADVSRWLFTELAWWPVELNHPRVEYGPSVKEEHIRRFAALPGDAGEACRLRLRYQALCKYASTYTRSLVDLADQAGDGRLHTSYKQDGTDTVRYSSSMPNQSNLPRSKRQALPWMSALPDIRASFLPTPGWDIVIFDFSQIELRLLAHYSRDPAMMACYIPDKDGKTVDIHENTRLSMQASSEMEVDRGDAKITNFSTIYKISKWSLARKLAMGTNDWTTYTPDVSQGFIDGFESAYPGVPRYQERAIRYAEEHDYATCLTGFKRKIDEWNGWGYNKDTGRRFKLRGSCERKAINTPIQASAGGILKRSLIGLYERWQSAGLLGQSVRIQGQVYDEIIVECLPEVRERVFADMKEVMESSAPELRVPIVAEGGYGDSWSSAK